MKLLTSEESQALDRETIKKGVPEIILMETASDKIKERVIKHIKNISNPKVLVLAGKGNNGGDGISTARKLFTDGMNVKVIVLGDRDNLSKMCEKQVKAFEVAGGDVLFSTDAEEISLEIRTFNPHLVIDSIVGTGLSGILRPPAYDVVNLVNKLKAELNFKVLSVDTPSGVLSDERTPEENPCISADETITFGFPKLGLVDFPAKKYVGKLKIANIGFFKNANILKKVKRELFTINDARTVYQKRSETAHKGSLGHIVIIGGSTGITGAVYLAGFSALRSGAGLVSVMLPETLCSSSTLFPEIMTYPLPAENDNISPKALERSLKFTSGKSVLIGNGIGRSPVSFEFVVRFIEHFEGNIVIDADGINALGGNAYILKHSPAKTKVITPHIGEMARLINKPPEFVEKNKEVIAKDIAISTNTIVVIKSAVSVVAFPNGQTFWNSSGTPALAVAGSGDVLAGMTAVFLTRFGEMGVPLAVFTHGLAGEIAEKKSHTESITPFDVINSIPDALKKISI